MPLAFLRADITHGSPRQRGPHCPALSPLPRVFTLSSWTAVTLDNRVSASVSGGSGGGQMTGWLLVAVVSSFFFSFFFFEAIFLPVTVDISPPVCRVSHAGYLSQTGRFR